MSGFNLVHDVLDMQLVDRRRQKIGRVDEIVLELRGDAPPRVAAILVGSGVRAERIGGWWAATTRVVRRLIGLALAGVTRIPFDTVRGIGTVIDVDIDGIETPALRGERRLRAFVRHIPGADSGTLDET